MTSLIQLIKTQCPASLDTGICWINKDLTTIGLYDQLKKDMEDFSAGLVILAAGDNPLTTTCCMYTFDTQTTKKFTLEDIVKQLTQLKPPVIDWTKPIKHTDSLLGEIFFLEDGDKDHVWLTSDKETRNTLVNRTTGFYIDDNSAMSLLGLNVINK